MGIILPADVDGIVPHVAEFNFLDYLGPDFDTARAERVCQFIECLIVPSGVGAGSPFKVRSWQRKFIYDVYAPIDPVTRTRMVRRAILSIARKNGKTAIIAALVLVHLIGPEAEKNGEIYSAANDRDQAAVVFKMVAQMVRADPELEGMLKVVDSTKTVASLHNGSFYRAISAEAGTKHGMNPTFVIYDELAQSKNSALYEVLDTSFGAREEPLFAVISTQSADPEHILSTLIDDGLNSEDPTIVCHLYEVHEDVEDIFDPAVWLSANPALGDFRNYADFKALADKAQRMPAEEPKFRNLFLNQRVSAVSSLISRRDWLDCTGDRKTLVPGERVYAALDLSSVNDLAALTLVSEDGDRSESWFWKPESVLKDHSERDFGKAKSPKYVEWHNEGWIRVTPGNTLDYEVIATDIAEVTGEYEFIGMAYDRWRISFLIREFNRIQFNCQIGEGDGLDLIEWGQGFKDMGPAIDHFERVILEGSLRHNGNPCLTWTIANAIVVTDPAGNRKLDKEKAKFRIDGAVSLAMCLGYKYRDYDDADDESYIHTAGIVIL